MATTAGKTKISQTMVNKAALENSKAFITDCDQKYEKQISKIVRRISENTEKLKIVLISGPSASGKTTTSLKIKQGLSGVGINAVTISMDDFFMPRELTPELPNGNRDYESLEAIDLVLLKSLLLQLINEGRAELPMFNFKLGQREEKKNSVELGKSCLAVVEGLHALDTAVIQGLPGDSTLKIYISASSDFAGDDGNTLLTSRDIRLIRRTIRDYHFRGSTPLNTLDMWDTVCHGEDIYIRPFKMYADITVDSTFKCEPCLFKETAVKLFGRVNRFDANYTKAQMIIKAVSGFEQIPVEFVPGSCVLRC